MFSKSFVATFSIGLVAGITPFMTMQILPLLLDPSTQAAPQNYWALVLWGVMVGCIVAILFSKGFETAHPREIFLYALGIPTLLLGTVSNLTTQFDKNRQISQIREMASSNIVNQAGDAASAQVPIQTMDAAPVPVTPVQEPQQGSFLSRLLGVAYAQPPGHSRDSSAARMRRDTTYVVIIGRYDEEKAAQAAYADFAKKKLRTETYVPKNLSLLKTPRLDGSSSYMLQYGSFPSQAMAVRTFQLLKVNDPETAPQILRF